MIIKQYTSEWCYPCKQLSPIMSEISQELGINFLKVDVDKNRDDAVQNNVSSVPTLVFIKNGQEIHRMTGVKPKQTIISIINQFK